MAEVSLIELLPYECHRNLQVISFDVMIFVPGCIGNGVVPLDNNPLPEPMLSQIYITVWCHKAAIATVILMAPLTRFWQALVKL